MTVAIIAWLGVAVTLIQHTYTYVAGVHATSPGRKALALVLALFMSLIWPYAVFMLARKAYLTHMLTDGNSAR